MTADQAVRLRDLAGEALELEAFNRNLSAAEADRRIHMFEAKLRLQDGAPHTV